MPCSDRLGRRTKRIYQFDPQNARWVVGESAKRQVEASIVSEVTSFCALTNHLSPFSPNEWGNPLAIRYERNKGLNIWCNMSTVHFRFTSHQLFMPLFLP